MENTVRFYPFDYICPNAYIALMPIPAAFCVFSREERYVYSHKSFVTIQPGDYVIEIKTKFGSTFTCKTVEEAVEILTTLEEPVIEKPRRFEDRMWRGKVYSRVQDMKTARTRSLHDYTMRTALSGFHSLKRVLKRDPTRLELADYNDIPAEKRWVLTAAGKWVPLMPEILFRD